MVEEPSYYELLDVESDASIAAIKAAFRQWILLHHPDNGGDQTLFGKVERAYEVLISGPERQRYDAALCAPPVASAPRLAASGSLVAISALVSTDEEPTPPSGTPAVMSSPGSQVLRSSSQSERQPGQDPEFVSSSRRRKSPSWMPTSAMKRRLIGLILVTWAVFAVVVGRHVVPGFDNAAVFALVALLAFAWLLGSIALRAAGAFFMLFALLSGLGGAGADRVVSLVLVGVGSWLGGHWFYTWRHGTWRSRIAKPVLARLPGRLRPDSRWSG